MIFNHWLHKRASKNIKKKCKFVLYENVSSKLGLYYDWSEVYWTTSSMNANKHVEFDEENQILTWKIPEDCHIDGFCIVHDDNGTLFTERIGKNGMGIDLYKTEQIHVNIGSIQVFP